MQSPVPMLTHALNTLAKILTKAEAHCEEHKIDPNALLTARLYPDMFTLIRNVQTVSDTSKGMVARLGQLDNPSYEDNEASFAELQERIAKTLAFIKDVPDSAFEGAETREVVLQAGPQEFKFSGAGYMASFAQPNFYFHMTTVYNILRHNGVPLGKRDFLGA